MTEYMTQLLTGLDPTLLIEKSMSLLIVFVPIYLVSHVGTTGLCPWSFATLYFDK